MPWDENGRWYDGPPESAPGDQPASSPVVPPTRMDEPVAPFPGMPDSFPNTTNPAPGGMYDRHPSGPPVPPAAGGNHTVFDEATESAERLMGFLVLVSTKLDEEHRYFRLRKGVSFIGRFGSRAQIEIRDQQVSAQHALIVCTNSANRVLDLDSANGIQINGSQTEYHEMQEGDRIRIGTNELVFVPFPYVAED